MIEPNVAVLARQYLFVLIVGIQSHLWWGYPKQSSFREALSRSTTDCLEQHMPAAVRIVATGNEDYYV